LAGCIEISQRCRLFHLHYIVGQQTKLIIFVDI